MRGLRVEFTGLAKVLKMAEFLITYIALHLYWLGYIRLDS